jgi:hypothetical protein
VKVVAADSAAADKRTRNKVSRKALTPVSAFFVLANSNLKNFLRAEQRILRATSDISLTTNN